MRQAKGEPSGALPKDDEHDANQHEVVPVALAFAAPAAVAGYALVHGVTKESVPSEIWRQIFCIIGGAFVGISALLRLAGGRQPARSREA